MLQRVVFLCGAQRQKRWLHGGLSGQKVLYFLCDFLQGTRNGLRSKIP
nr:MAG TPA: hypothetical protein [Caudoviricetes sp.]